MYDVAVIGAGPGGYVAAIRAAQLGLKVVCIEKERSLGGTCLNVGCIPSKTLLHTTEYYAWLRDHGQELGIICPESSLDFLAMMQRKEKVVQGLVEGIAGLFKRYGVKTLLGNAHFIDAHKLEVTHSDGVQQVEADSFILATGSEPIPLPFAKFDEKVILSSTGALSLTAIPKKMVVIGGGVIGVELASVYNRLGTEVVVIEMLNSICPAMDEAVSKALLQSLKKQGMSFHLGAKVSEIKQLPNHAGASVTFEPKEQLHADVVLVCVGRRPYSQGLGLSEIGVGMQRGFVAVDANFRSNLSHIYAIGDLIDGPMLAHRASEEGRVVADIIAGKASAINYMAIPNVIYTHPEAAAVGLTEKEARDMGLNIVVGMSSFKGNPRARCNGDMEGFVKVIGAGPDQSLVGMHILGSQASELIAEGVIAIEKRATLKEIADAPHAHPTLSEAIKEACEQALRP